METLTCHSIKWATILLMALQIVKADSFEGWTPEQVQQFHAHYKVKAEEYRIQAEKGDASAQIKLGVLYHEGRGLTKDFVQAVFWYRKAANQGDAYAQWILANRYHRGEGVAKDDVEAYAYWNLAGITLQEGRDEVAALEKKLSRDEVVAGQKRTRELKLEIEASMAAKSVVSDSVATVVGKVAQVADSRPSYAPEAEQTKGGPLIWVILVLLILAVIVVGIVMAVLTVKKAASIAHAKASGNSYADSKQTHGFFYYWALSSLAILAFLSVLGYLNGGASGFYYQLGRGLVLAPVGGLVFGGIWKMMSK